MLFLIYTLFCHSILYNIKNLNYLILYKATSRNLTLLVALIILLLGPLLVALGILELTIDVGLGLAKVIGDILEVALDHEVDGLDDAHDGDQLLHAFDHNGLTDVQGIDAGLAFHDYVVVSGLDMRIHSLGNHLAGISASSHFAGCLSCSSDFLVGNLDSDLHIAFPFLNLFSCGLNKQNHICLFIVILYD